MIKNKKKLSKEAKEYTFDLNNKFIKIKNMRKSLRYNIILRLGAEGGFTVIVPSLPWCVTYGRNLKETKEMVA